MIWAVDGLVYWGTYAPLGLDDPIIVSIEAEYPDVKVDVVIFGIFVPMVIYPPLPHHNQGPTTDVFYTMYRSLVAWFKIKP